MNTILLVEDDSQLFEILSEFLRDADRFSVVGARSGAQAIDAVAKNEFDLVILDILLPGINGIDVCERIRRSVACPILFISCLDDEQTMLQAFSMGGGRLSCQTVLEPHSACARGRLAEAHGRTSAPYAGRA